MGGSAEEVLADGLLADLDAARGGGGVAGTVVVLHRKVLGKGAGVGEVVEGEAPLEGAAGPGHVAGGGDGGAEVVEVGIGAHGDGLVGVVVALVGFRDRVVAVHEEAQVPGAILGHGWHCQGRAVDGVGSVGGEGVGHGGLAQESAVGSAGGEAEVIVDDKGCAEGGGGVVLDLALRGERGPGVLGVPVEGHGGGAQQQVVGGGGDVDCGVVVIVALVGFQHGRGAVHEGPDVARAADGAGG